MKKEYLFSIVFLASLHTVVFAQECVLKKDQDNISVYTCDGGSSRFKSIKASFTMEASTSVLATLVLDVVHYTEWQFRTVKSRIVKRISDREMIYYVEVSAPWPITNRDLVVHFKMAQDADTRIVHVSANGVPSYIPPVEGLVRVPSSSSQWTITPDGQGKVKIDYAIQIDPGGSVPAWMVNQVAANAPYESFRNLKARFKMLGNKIPATPFIAD